MAVDEEMLALAREVQACDVRLGLMPNDGERAAALRRELERRRDEAARRLAALEQAAGWPRQPDDAA